MDKPDRSGLRRCRRRYAARAAGVLFAASACLAAGAVSAADPRRCELRGDPVHWIADWCMAKLQTDDEIAAGDCIAREIEQRPAGDCRAKRLYKQRLCRLAVDRGRLGGIAACVADEAFFGTAVRDGGVGASR